MEVPKRLRVVPARVCSVVSSSHVTGAVTAGMGGNVGVGSAVLGISAKNGRTGWSWRILRAAVDCMTRPLYHENGRAEKFVELWGLRAASGGWRV